MPYSMSPERSSLVPQPTQPRPPSMVRKEDAGFRYADDLSRSWSTCRHFDGVDACEIVIGLIQPTTASDFWEPSGKPYEDYDADDLDVDRERSEGAQIDRDRAAKGFTDRGDISTSSSEADHALCAECGHPIADECECECETTEHGGSSMPTPYAKNPPHPHQRVGNSNGGFNQGALLKLLEDVRRKCDEIQEKYCSSSPGTRAIEMFRSTYDLKRRLPGSGRGRA
jgi:hypothetical protein